MELTARQKALYETIKSAALAGEVCPTNREIAQRSGLASTSTVADVLGRLHRKGVVAVKRFNRARVVALPDLGIATAEPPARSALGHAPHWRDRPPGVSYQPTPEPSVFPPPMPWRLKWRPQRWRPSTCQYFAGPPSTDEGAKCGKPVIGRSSYCARHHALCHRRPQEAEPQSAIASIRSQR